LSIGSDGIHSAGGIATIWGHENNGGPGAVTSIGRTLFLYSKSGSWNSLDIRGYISDSRTGKVELRVENGNRFESGFGIVRIKGIFSSTFTGDVTVEGKNSHLYLDKENGATAVRSNIYVRNGATIGIERSNQIADTSSVTLQGKGSTFLLNSVSRNLSEKFRTLTVEGEGHVLFDHKFADRYAKTLIIDNLIIGEGSTLSVDGWRADLDLFLVKIDYKNREALKRVKFTGINQGIVELVYYNNNYWKLHASPEPRTYGAILGGMGVLLALGRRCRCFWRKVSTRRSCMPLARSAS